MMATENMREYALDLLVRSDDNVVLHKRTRERLEKLPCADWWDLSRSQDGSERLEIRIGSRYYYIYYWTRYLIDGRSVDRCVRIPKDSDEGKQFAEMLNGA